MFSYAVLVGRIGAEPEVRMTSSGRSVLNFRVAVDRRIGTGENVRWETDWHRVVIFGDQAERRAKELHKGDLIIVSGELRVRRFRDRQGVDRTIVEISANRVRRISQSRAGAPGTVAPEAEMPTPSLEEEFPVQDLSEIPTLPEDEEEFEEEDL